MKTTILISGMSCEHCTASVKNALEKLPSVSAVNVLLESKSAEVEHNGADIPALRTAVEDLGFDVDSIS